MKFVIETDLTNKGTKIMCDGVDMCTDKKVTDISFSAYAANTKYNDQGYSAVSITSFDAEGNRKREYYSNDGGISTDYKGIGTQDELILTLSDIINFIGNEVIVDEDIEKTTLVDSIIEHCTKNAIKCSDKETLMVRSIDSLKDRITDLGISSEDTQI